MVDVTDITPVARTTQRLGWKPPLPDPRYAPRMRFRSSNPLPSKASTSTSPFMPPIYDQSNLGSCTGNGTARAYAFARAKQGLSPLWNPSRLFIYYNERVAEGTVSTDAGASVQDGIKSLVRVGVCDENLWPYDISKFKDKPSDNVYAEAGKHAATTALSVMQTPDELRGCIAAGFPFVFGFTVWSSFERIGSDGVMPVPDTWIEHTIGGHCVVACDYDDETQYYKCANSWGTSWGVDGGFFYFPYQIMHDQSFAADFWQIDAVAS